jgi:hypothetical protein
MKKTLKSILLALAVFVMSFCLLWLLVGSIRLHQLNEELRTDMAENSRTVEILKEKIEESDPISAEEWKDLNTLKKDYLYLSYLLVLERETLDQKTSSAWLLIDVYTKQRMLFWGFWSLQGGELFVKEWKDCFVPFPDQSSLSNLEKEINEKKARTQCSYQPMCPEGFLNRKAYSSTRPLQLLFRRICSDSEREDDLLNRTFQVDAALFLSTYIQGFSDMKWYELPIYGWAPGKGFVTFRYIWFDISWMIGSSFFVSCIAFWWKYRQSKKTLQ